MTTFETGAELSVTVNPQSLSAARDEIEGELDDVQVDVSTTGGGGGRGGGGRGRRRQRSMAMNLSSIDSAWDDNLVLNEERNDLLRQLLDVTERDAQSSGRGPLSSLGGMALGGIGLVAGAGALGLSAVSDTLKNFEWPDLPDVPDFPDLGVPDDIPDLGVPNEVPDLGVPDVPDLGLPDIPDLGLPDVPDLGVPDEVPDLGMPDVPDLGVPDEVPDLGVPDVDPLELAKPDWIPIPVASPESSPADDGGGIDPLAIGSGVAAAGLTAAETFGGHVSSAAGRAGGAIRGGTGSSGGLGIPSPVALFAQQMDRSRRTAPEDRGPVENFFANARENLKEGRQGSQSSTQPVAAGPSGETINDITNQNTFEINADLSDVKRETSDKISDLESEVENLKRDIVG